MRKGLLFVLLATFAFTALIGALFRFMHYPLGKELVYVGAAGFVVATGVLIRHIRNER